MDDVQAGQLNRRVTLQQPDPDSPKSAKGQRQTAYLDVASVWARIRSLSTREQFMASQQQASGTHEITIRYSPMVSAVDGSWRVLYGDRIFVIEGLPDIVNARKTDIVLLCTEGPRKK